MTFSRCINPLICWWKSSIRPHFWEGCNIGLLLGLIFALGSCVLSSCDNNELQKQNRELKEQIVRMQSYVGCMIDGLDEQLKCIKGEMLPKARVNDLVTEGDEREKNTLLALKKFDEGDYGSAYEYARKGNLDNPELLFMIGWMYYEGNVVKQSMKDAFRSWNKAANAGNVKAKFDLGVMYGKGEYVEQDLQKSAMWLTKAAEDGLPLAAFHLGLAFERGRGVARSGRKALEWYERAFNLGYAHAGYHIANMYEAGRGVEKNHDMARKWFLKASEKGDVYAAERVALTSPIIVNDSNDILEGSMLYNLAKNGSPIARSRIIDAYEYGIDVGRDMSKAYNWCVEAAEDGKSIFQIRAGDMCLSGDVKGRGARDAFAWYKMALDDNYTISDACYKLGCLYMTGNGVAKDEKRAIALFTRADTENDGLEEAQVALGDAYHDGKGVEKDLSEALRWYKKAAETDNANALLRLGNMYEQGEGVASNRLLASQYYERAIEAAFEESVEEEARKGLMRIKTNEGR